MQLTLLILVVGASLCMGMERTPGLMIVLTDESQTLFHNDVDFRKLLEEKLNSSIIPTIHRNFSTILGSKITIDLKDCILKSYDRPEFVVSIDLKEGIVLNVSVPMMQFDGMYVVRFDNGLTDRLEWLGNFTLLVRKTSLKIRKEIDVETEENKVKWLSTNMTGSIDIVEIHTDDVELDGMLALIDSNDVMKAVIDCFGDAYKNLTEYETDNSYNITDDIHLDMSLVGQPIIFDGGVAFPHRAEAVFNGDDRTYMYEVEPPKLDVVQPNAYVLYSVSELPFNSLLWVVHNHKLLSHTFTKANLPENSKDRLNTTCEKDCSGKLFPQAALQFPDSSIELDMDTNSPPYVNIKSESFKIWMEFNCSAKARKNAEPLLKDVFNVHLNVSASVESSVKGTKIHLGLLRAHSNVDVIDSKIGYLDIESVRDLCHMILEDKLAAILVETKVKGKELKLNEPVEDYGIITKEKYVNLLLHLKAIGNM